MRNPIKEKITDLKFAALRLESVCKDDGLEQSADWLAQAILNIEKAVSHAEHTQAKGLEKQKS